MRTNPFLLLTTAAVLVASFGSGCTHVAATLHRANHRIEEHSRAYTTAVVEALQLQPTHQRDRFTTTALQLAQRDQRIEGIPLDSIPVADLIDSSPTNRDAHAAATMNLARRDEELRGLLAQKRRGEERLITFGEQFEQSRNEQRLHWFKRTSAFTLLVGALVAVFVLCPALLPVAGRVVAWCVGRFPAVAGSVGVVSVNAFDAVVKAIERTRRNIPSESTPRFGNQAPSGDDRDDLFLNLSREMDAAHKALVRKRKVALVLDR